MIEVRFGCFLFFSDVLSFGDLGLFLLRRFFIL